MNISKLFKTLLMRFFYYTRNRAKRTVYFVSSRGQYSDSPRAISEAIHGIDPTIQLIWRSKKGVSMPSYVKQVFSKFEVTLVQARADAWVMNNLSNPDKGTWKSPSVFFVETWHGDRGFKKIAYAAKEAMGEGYHDIAEDKSNFDLFTAASDYGEMKARKGLRYKGKILKIGLPRNDKLIHPEYHKEYANEIRQELGISSDVKILLYAPTFRDKTKGVQSVDVDLKQTMEALKDTGYKWVCLVRAHSVSKGLDVNFDNVMDVTSFGDMSDLLLIADCLISDYSSCSGDFILTRRPCVLAHFDRDSYESKDRSLWYNPDETGYLIAKNQDQMNEIMRNLYSYDHVAISQKVLDFYKSYDKDNSSMVVAQSIVDWVNRSR